LAVLLGAGMAWLVFRPRLAHRRNDAVEQVATDYLQAIMKEDLAAQHRLSTIEEPPAIRSFQPVTHDRSRDRTLKGSFAPLARLHQHIEAEYAYDPAIGRFTPKHPLGAAAEVLDAAQAAREEAKKSRMYEKMASGDPNDIFDAAESLGKVFTQLADGALAPKKILPNYKMLVDEAKPPLPGPAKELAEHVADHPGDWNALLKRPFHALKPDGPFVLDLAEVDAGVTDKLASLGDPPTTLRLALVRFQLEGIDTGWRIISARRILPDDEPAESSTPIHSPGKEPPSPPDAPAEVQSPGNP
jgi:hypothetical protein